MEQWRYRWVCIVVADTTGILATSQTSLEFAENDPQNGKYPVSGSCVAENALLNPGVRMDRLVGTVERQ